MGSINTPATVDISQVVAESQRHAERIKATTDTLDATSGAHAESVQREVDAINKEGELVRDSKLLLDALTIQKEKRNAESAANFGVNEEAHNSIVREMSQGIIEQHKDLKAAGVAILKKKEVGFSDDPIEWLFNTFTIPRDVQAYRTREAILDRDVKTLSSLENLAQEQVKTNNAIAATTSAQISALQAEAGLKAATVRAENARQEAARFGLQVASVRLATSHQQFEAVLQVHGAQVNLQRLELEKAQKAISEKQLELQRQNLQLTIDKRNTDAKAHAELQASLDAATAVAGMRKISVEEYERAPQQTKAALFDIMANPNTAMKRLGSDPADALANADRLNAPLTPQVTMVKEALLAITTKTAQSNKAWQSLKPDEQKRLVNDAIKDTLRGEYNAIPDSGSIYSAPPLASLKGIPAINSTVLWRSTFAPQAENPMRPTSAQAFYDTAVDLVFKGTMTQDQAAKELSQIYKAIAVDNSQQRDFNRLALPMQEKYRTSIKAAGADAPWAYSAGRVIDMANQTEVNNALTRSMVAKKNMETGQMFPLEGTPRGP